MSLNFFADFSSFWLKKKLFISIENFCYYFFSQFLFQFYTGIYFHQIYWRRNYSNYTEGKFQFNLLREKFFLLTLLLEKFYWRKSSFNYNENTPTGASILMKTQSSVWTWTLNLDLGFVKNFQLYGGKKLFQSSWRKHSFEFTTRKVFSTLQREFFF